MQDIELVANWDDSPGVVDHRIDRMGVMDSIVIFINKSNDFSLPSPFSEGTVLIDAGINLSGRSHPDTGNARSQSVG